MHLGLKLDEEKIKARTHHVCLPEKWKQQDNLRTVNT